jgi:copper resistance protein C
MMLLTGLIILEDFMIIKRRFPLPANFVMLATVIVLMFAFALASGAYNPVSAHDVQPTKADPVIGAAVAQSPDKLTVWFPEEILPATSTLQVFDAQGKQVDLGQGGVDLNDTSHMVMVVGLPKLTEAVYSVKWNVGLTDGDSANGTFYFGVGNVTVPTAVPEPAAPAAAAPAKSTLPVGGIIAGVVGLILIAVFIIWMVRRNRPTAAA